MASILIATVPIHGHVTPLLAVGRHFVERGDRVRFLTGARFASAVRATGAEHLPLPAAADFDDRIDLNHRFPERAKLSGAKSLAFDIIELFTRPARAQHDAVMAAHAAEPADAVLVDPAFAGAAFVLGHPRASRPAVVMCGVLPLSLASRDTAPFGMGMAPSAGPFGRLRNALLAGLAGRILAPAQRFADGMYREVHGTGMPGPVLDWPRHADAIAQFTVPQFEYPRSDAPPNLHFVGPISASGSSAPLPAWWAEVEQRRPVVHVTQGTIANKDFGQLVGPTLQALADEDVLVVVSTGGQPLEKLPPLPANARAAEYLPYDQLLPKTDVFVTNAGYGGVQYALRYGVPIVASGGTEDKPEVGARVAWAGVGRRLTALSPKADHIRQAVKAVLHDERYRRAAAAMAERMARSGGLDALSRIVDGAARPSAAPAPR
jgi:MGT family glycosyltransferase